MAFVNSSGMESIVLEMDEKLVKTCHFRCGTARDRPLEQSRINKKICGTDNSATRFSSRLVMYCFDVAFDDNGNVLNISHDS